MSSSQQGTQSDRKAGDKHMGEKKMQLLENYYINQAKLMAKLHELFPGERTFNVRVGQCPGCKISLPKVDVLTYDAV
jgi:hypothetical protein